MDLYFTFIYMAHFEIFLCEKYRIVSRIVFYIFVANCSKILCLKAYHFAISLPLLLHQ